MPAASVSSPDSPVAPPGRCSTPSSRPCSRVRHRGAVAADHRTGDGAGVLLPLPSALLPEPGLGIAMVFLRNPDGRREVEEACLAEGIAVRSWRSVPVDLEALGPAAQASAPTIEQALLEPPAGDADGIEAAAFRARKRLDGRDDLYVASLSFRTVVYKALCAADQLAPFYADLRDPAVEVRFGVFHQRFSTNTEPSWERTQPFRLLCHNGEINAIRGNVNWMRARALTLGRRRACARGGELRLGDARQRARAAGARRPRPAPCADDADSARLAGRSRARRRRCATSIASTPGWSSPGTARPASSSPTAASSAPRSTATASALFATSSPAISSAARPRRVSSTCRPEHVRSPGRLGPGEMLSVDTDRGLEEDGAIKLRLAGSARTGAGSKSGDARRRR